MTYRHKPTLVNAWRVEKPFYRLVADIQWLKLVRDGRRVSAAIIPEQGVCACVGDWIVEVEPRIYRVMSDAQFHANYERDLPEPTTGQVKRKQNDRDCAMGHSECE